MSGFRWALLGIALFGCAVPVDDEPSLCEVIGPDGGSVWQNDVGLAIPPDALSRESTICITASDEVPPLVATSQVWHFEPDDLEFDVPAEVLIPFPQTDFFPHLYWLDQGEYQQVEYLDLDGALVGEVSHLGFGFVGHPEANLEQFTYEPAEVDLLFVVDSSCSMSEEQQALTLGFPDFLNNLDAAGFDYHAGVVSMDMDDSSHQGKLREASGFRWVQPDT
ncbi:MAG: hypothetical protein HN348_33795, partial [Proteobacteria bacterium]|nr:hypothetical protein [Pseudomonadota bacterium]